MTSNLLYFKGVITNINKKEDLSELIYPINAPISVTFRLNKQAKSKTMSSANTDELNLLIKSCMSDNRQAQENLYKKFFSLLMSVCLRYKKNEQDASASLNIGFYKILVNLDKYDYSIPFEYWIRRIMINQCIDEYRRDQRHKAIVFKEEITDFEMNNGQVTLNEVNEHFTNEHLQSMLVKLPEQSKRVFNLFAIDGFSHKEISEMMSIPEGTSKWYLSEARKKLKEMVLAEFPHLNIG